MIGCAPRTGKRGWNRREATPKARTISSGAWSIMVEVPGLQRVREALARCCDSDVGAERASKRHAARNAIEATERLQWVEEAAALADRQLVVAIADHLAVDDAVARARRGSVLDTVELRRIGALLQSSCELARRADPWRVHAPSLAALAQRLPTPQDIATDLVESFDEHGELRDEASPALRRLRGEVRGLSAGMRKRIGELVRDSDSAGLLQDDYWTIRNDRFVLPVKASDRRMVEGIVHGSSATGATVYVEPTELVAQNNRLAMAIEDVRAEERRILAALSADVGSVADDVVQAADGLATLDLVFASARFAVTLGATRPTLAMDAVLTLRKARHPLLVLEGNAVVANDVALVRAAYLHGAERTSADATADATADASRPGDVEQPRWLVISGPNGGGKTVTLTTVALAAEMARLGLYVCAAEGSVVPWVEGVDIVLGDAQDLDRGLSTFSGHLERLRGLLDRCQGAPRRLVLIDEIASGTEPAAGSALARAVLETLATTASMGVVTTHDEAVKLMATADGRFANAALELDAKTAAPTFRLRLGAVGSSNPLALAARVGMPTSVLDRAGALLGGGGADTTALLERLDQMQRDLQRSIDEQHAAKRQLDEARERLEAQRRHEQIAADKRIAEAARAAMAEIDRINAQLQEAKAAIASQEPPQALEKWSRQLLAQQRELRAKTATSPSAGPIRREPVAVEALRPGSEVFHPGLGRIVRVVEVDERRGEVRVAAGALEIRASMADLTRPTGGDNRPPQQRTKRDTDAVHQVSDRPTRAGAAPQTPRTSNPAAGGGTTPRASDAADVPAEAREEDASATASMRSDESTCDLRGMRVDDALAQVDAFLDRAIVQGKFGVTLVHGHGTGALKKAVEAHLRKHHQVQASRKGGRGEGGDGATLVWLRV